MFCFVVFRLRFFFLCFKCIELVTFSFVRSLLWRFEGCFVDWNFRNVVFASFFFFPAEHKPFPVRISTYVMMRNVGFVLWFVANIYENCVLVLV